MTHGRNVACLLIVGEHPFLVGGYPDVAPLVVHYMADGIVLRGFHRLWQLHHFLYAASADDVSADVLLSCAVHP